MRYFIPFFAALVACNPGEGELTGPEAFEAATEELERTSQTIVQPPNVAGCGDISVYAYNDDDTRGVLVSVQDELAWDAANAGTPISASYTLPHPDVHVEAYWGQGVTEYFCNDVIDPNNPTVLNGQAMGITGTIHVTVQPTGTPDQVQPWEFPGTATVEFEDVTFEHAPTGATKTVGAAILEDVFVGWLPG